MTWYVSSVDFNLWQNSEAGDEDDGSIFEVRLTDDTELDATNVGVGYELKTLK